MSVNPSVAIFAMLCIVIVTLAALRKAPPEHIHKIFEAFVRWFKK
jgi:hypothetical protein